MSEFPENKTYEPFKIPDRQQIQENRDCPATPLDRRYRTETAVSPDQGLFYVIDYSLGPIEGVGKFVLKPQRIEPPERDEIRDRFQAMRNIARANRSQYFYGNRFYDQRAHQENANIFYQQALFMKDFSDHYQEKHPFKEYFPYYQLMNDQQLRTYFTWRTAVRQGFVAETSLSYAFLYLYELINNIGVDDPQDGLNKLMSFWSAFRTYDSTIDKYIFRWLKDYHIYYQMPHSFKEFVDRNNLASHYPKLADTGDHFDLFCAISKYDIRSSAFFSADRIKLFTDCFYFVTNKLRQVFLENGIPFDESIFQPAKKMTVWQPFKDALFHHWLKQPDRRIILSEHEIYICSQNHWAFNTVITTESGRQLIGYLMKQIEADLRTATKYKYKLTANIDTVTHAVVGKLNAAGLSLEKIISAAVREFYREATRTVVSVDRSMLSRIRQEALATQKKLIVEEQDESFRSMPAPLNLSVATPRDMPPIPESVDESAAIADAWEGLKNALSATELQALLVVMLGETDLKEFADDHNVMQEVLIDSINGKAVDFIGDHLFDEELAIYDDYKDKIKEMAG